MTKIEQHPFEPGFSSTPHLMPFQDSYIFRLSAPFWVRPLVITLGVLCGAAVAGFFGSLIFAVVSLRVPAVSPDPAGFAELMNRRQASLASGGGPTEPGYETGRQILDAPALPSPQRVPAPAEPGPISTRLGDQSTSILLAGQAAPVTIDTSERLNVLILGVDVADRFVGNTDVIMLLSADLDSGSVALISFPRDLCVADCSRSSDRLNGIYSRYGAEAMLEVMTELTGQPIAYYAVVNFDGFARIIDRLGGVDINANRDFDDIVPNPDGPGGILQLSRGENHLDGSEALMYARSRRYDPSGDFARICRQQQIVTSLISGLLRPASLIDIPSLLMDLGGAVESNVPVGDLVGLLQLASTISPGDITREVILNDGISGITITGSDGSYLIRAGQEAIRAEVADATLPGAALETPATCLPD